MTCNHTYEKLEDGTEICFECDKVKTTKGGKREGAGRPKGTTKPDSEKRLRIPMTTIHPANHKYLLGLKADGFSLAKVFDEMIEDHKAKGNSR